MSPPGNLYASTLVRLAGDEPPAPTLALVAAVALYDAVIVFCSPAQAGAQPPAPDWAPACAGEHAVRSPVGADDLLVKWPNDLLLGGAKLSGILLERTGDAVVIGFGVNLAHHPHDLDRPATSLAVIGGDAPGPDAFLATLADSLARWLAFWRDEGLAAIRAAWLERAHPIGAPLTVRLPDGDALAGRFDGLDDGGALRLRLADGAVRVIHAADVVLMRD